MSMSMTLHESEEVIMPELIKVNMNLVENSFCFPAKQCYNIMGGKKSWMNV